jgi:hypothetical protein
MSVENINVGLRTLVDGNMDVFRYGLSKGNIDSDYEDPTFLGFTIEIDENSALFNEVGPFLEKHGASRAEMNARIPVYKEFTSKIVQLFKSQESVEEQGQQSIYIKQHYINSISGLDNLSKKFIKWREDKLSVQLHEDITMYSSYIASIYNNLTYSYENGRMMIPENLLKFNLKIKISEIRNLTSIAKLKSTDPIEMRIVDGLKNNITCIVYTLYDCEFDFFGSRPFENDIEQAGIGANMPGHSTVGFDIYFKSVSRNIFNPLVTNAMALNDNVVDLGVVIIGTDGNRSPNGQVTDASSTTVGANGEAYQELVVDGQATQRIFNFPNDRRKPSAISTYNMETANKPELIDDQVDLAAVAAQREELIAYNKELAPDIQELKNSTFDPLSPNGDNTILDKIIGKDLTNIIQDPTKALNNLTNSVKNKVENTVKDQLQKAVQSLKRRRNELVKNFIYDLQANVGLKRIIPDNVYTNQDYYKNALDQLKSDVGLTIGDAIVKAVTNN